MQIQFSGRKINETFEAPESFKGTDMQYVDFLIAFTRASYYGETPERLAAIKAPHIKVPYKDVDISKKHFQLADQLIFNGQ